MVSEIEILDQRPRRFLGMLQKIDSKKSNILYVTIKIISDVLKVSTTNYSRDIRNEMGIRTSTRKTTKLNKQMNKKGNDLENCQFSE